MEENKMGVMPVNKLLISMALPMMISMLVQALYNIVDSMFVAQISENALTAVSLAFPAQNLMIAVGTGTGVGINALVSRSLGERNGERANLIANNGLLLYVLSGIVFALFGIFGSRLFFRAQTSDLEIVELGTQYLRICCLLSTAIFLQFGFERILQATGRTIYTMLTQGLGAIVNIILDPILIFGLFGAPKLGVRGAAVATVFGQICAAGLACFFNKKKNDDIVINPKKYHLQAHAGEFAKDENEIVINQHLAEQNQIVIGDELYFISGNEDGSARVTGFYLTGNERKQTENVLTINRIENQIYTTLSFAVEMGAEKYEEIDALSGLQQPLQLFIHSLLLSASRLTESIGSFIIAKRVRSRNCFSDQIRRKKMFTKINVYFWAKLCYTIGRIARVGRPGRQI